MRFVSCIFVLTILISLRLLKVHAALSVVTYFQLNTRSITANIFVLQLSILIHHFKRKCILEFSH